MKKVKTVDLSKIKKSKLEYANHTIKNVKKQIKTSSITEEGRRLALLQTVDKLNQELPPKDFKIYVDALKILNDLKIPTADYDEIQNAEFELLAYDDINSYADMIEEADRMQEMDDRREKRYED